MYGCHIRAQLIRGNVSRFELCFIFIFFFSFVICVYIFFLLGGILVNCELGKQVGVLN